ncbi:HlyC/CorC family transporter [bacterium]|nr:HlyC/CorC family transporter [bacterium]
MDVASTSWNLFLVLFFTLLNGFFVAAEFAMVKVRPSRLQQLSADGNSQARVAQHIIENLDAYLSGCQLGITLSSLALGALGEPAIATLIAPGLAAIGAPAALTHTIAFAIAFTVITALHIVIGEQAPKTLAIRKAEDTTLLVAWPLKLFYNLVYPAIWILNGMSNRFLHMLGVPPVAENEAAHTEDEIRILMKESAKSGHIDEHEMALFERVFHFAERVAREIMVPRVDMICLDRNEPFEALLAIAEQEQHTRYPVCDGDKDNIVGFVHIKDLYAAKHQDLTRITRPLMAVPASLEISQVLRQMQKAKAHMALVMDEYGGTAGMLTVEDILEEIVGEIQDEFDNERPRIERKGSAFSVDGLLLVDDLNELFGLEIEAEEDIVGGWLYTRLGHAPQIGDSIEENGVTFKVEEIEHLRITRVLVEGVTPVEGALIQ